MINDPTLVLVLIVLLGTLAQWVAWKSGLPSILVLLVTGFMAGPVIGWLNPDELLGDSLLPLASLAVAVILFEGGLSLRYDELRKVGRVVRNLLTIGVATTWLLASAAAYFIVELDAPLAVILGALLTVTGPTVIFPMLRQIRPRGRVASILRWEGIANDPIGALLAVLAFEFVIATEENNPAAFIAVGLVKTLIAGGGLGVFAGFGLAAVLRRYWVPDYLANPVSLAVAIAVFALSNGIQEDSGLFAVTVAGMALANRSPTEARHILEFKENIRVLLISLLFIILSARFTPADFRSLLEIRTVMFVVTLIVVVRPASVLLSTLGTPLSWSERLFLAWVAPRGIVAAAVSSVFALGLSAAGYEQAGMLMLLTFATIIGTVAIYGTTAAAIARRLGLAERDPQGVVLVGAHGWACSLAKAIKGLGFHVLLLDTDRRKVAAARMQGLTAHSSSALSESVGDEIELGAVGRALALTPNDEVNALASLQFSRILGRSSVFQLAPVADPGRKVASEKHLHGRWLFGNDVTFWSISEQVARGWAVKATKLTAEYNFDAFLGRYPSRPILLCVATSQGRLQIVPAESSIAPLAGQTVVALVPPAPDAAA